ncbi:MAG: hypothetical protein HGB12_13090 [Bacteroidetes bacterium]|nr:hypothetical protein [Bacteroidota bacterium]
MNKFFTIFFIALLFSCYTFPQANVKDSAISTSMFSIAYSYQIPGGDLSKRYFSNSSVGGSYFYKSKNNWIVSISGNFFFKDTIKESGIFNSISTNDGCIIDGNGLFADINLYERGFLFDIKAGELFSFFGPNKNSGIVILGGFGFLQHKIRIENKDNASPQIKDDYKKGYDRLTNGFATSEFIGYMYLGNTRLVSFYAGFEFIQAFTKNRRSYNFDLMSADNTKRIDILSGFKIGWIIPLFKRSPDKFYYH